MATPDWFDPVTIGSGDYARRLIGGCMKTYNPIMEALKETRSTHGCYPISSVISIGCGKHAAHKLRDNTKEELNGTLLSMIHDCNDIADEVHNDFCRMPQFQSIYQRFSVDQEMTNIDITDWSLYRFADINAQTVKYIGKAEVKKALDVAVKNLMGGIPYLLPTVKVISEFNPAY
jgi:hypothetical protein